jgi:cytochrome b561
VHDLVAPDRATGHTLKEIHETWAEAGYFIVGLHAAAALFHHYVQRDSALAGMLPRT